MYPICMYASDICIRGPTLGFKRVTLKASSRRKEGKTDGSNSQHKIEYVQLLPLFMIIDFFI